MRDPILRQMEREEEERPLFNPILKALWKIRRGTHDLTGLGGLLPVHLGPRSLAREENP